VENALLYDSLNQTVRELEESEEELTRHRDQLEAKVVERTLVLNERVKELDCLYGISKLASKQDTTEEEIVAGTVSLLPDAFRYPGIACARIVLDDQEFKTDGYQETPWSVSADITVQGVQAGLPTNENSHNPSLTQRWIPS
jgi:nitrate/nitrite-specific signal transduction histidine kinase